MTGGPPAVLFGKNIMFSNKNREPGYKAEKGKDGMMKGLFAAQAILLGHVLLVCAIFFVMVFFQGVVRYMPWIFLSVGSVIAFFIWRIYAKMKREHKNLGDILRDPMFDGRSIEISFMGGAMQLKLGQPTAPLLIEDANPGAVRQIETRPAMQIRELTALAVLFERKLITEDEYNKAKSDLLSSQ